MEQRAASPTVSRKSLIKRRGAVVKSPVLMTIPTAATIPAQTIQRGLPERKRSWASCIDQYAGHADRPPR